MPTSAVGNVMCTSSQLRSVSAPMIHVTIWDATKGVGDRLIVSVVSETVMLERIMPASAKVMRLPDRPASNASVNIDETPPTKGERRQQERRRC